jgi:Glycosyltransferase family 87
MSDETLDQRRARQTAWIVWLVVTIVISIIIHIGKERSVTVSYRSAVEHWFAGEPLYNMGGSGFIYLPQAALVFAPWGLLPKPLGETLWRWTIIGVLAVGVSRLTRLVSRDERWFLIGTVCTAALSAGCARNGQSTLIITGLMILAVADISDQKWTRSAIWLALSFAFKPVAIVLILLVAALYRPMLWRLALGMAIVGVAPFLTQRPDYVISQFVACYQNTGVAFSDGETGYWAQLFGMLKVFGLDLPSPVQQSARIVAALATLGVCWKASRRLTPARSAYYLYSLAAIYLMLFNSRTEGSTYGMVGPVYGILLADAWLSRCNRVTTILLGLGVVVSAFNFEVALLFTPRPYEIWVCPLVCVGVTGYLLSLLWHELRVGSSNPAADVADSRSATIRGTV